MPTSLYGRPYKWAQWLCGLYMLTSPIVAPDSGHVIKPCPRPEPTTRKLVNMVRVACCTLCSDRVRVLYPVLRSCPRAGS